MVTKPVLPKDEAPFDEKSLHQFLSSMSTEMVLVGGQALAFWMNRFEVRGRDAVISNDGDALGSVRHALYLAKQFNATVVVPDPEALTSLVAQVRIPVANGKVRNIDVMRLLYTISGLSKSNAFTRRVQANAVTVQIEPGIQIKVMHPLDVLESRVHNAVGLIKEKGDHVVTQAKWAIEVARVAITRAAADPDFKAERVGKLVQRVSHLWTSSVGQRLFKEHELCVLDAVEVDRLLELKPDMTRQLAAVASAQSEIQEEAKPPRTRSREGRS